MQDLQEALKITVKPILTAVLDDLNVDRSPITTHQTTIRKHALGEAIRTIERPADWKVVLKGHNELSNDGSHSLNWVQVTDNEAPIPKNPNMREDLRIVVRREIVEPIDSQRESASLAGKSAESVVLTRRKIPWEKRTLQIHTVRTTVLVEAPDPEVIINFTPLYQEQPSQKIVTFEQPGVQIEQIGRKLISKRTLLQPDGQYLSQEITRARRDAIGNNFTRLLNLVSSLSK